MQPRDALVVWKLEIPFQRKNPWRCRGEYFWTNIIFLIMWKCLFFRKTQANIQLSNIFSLLELSVVPLPWASIEKVKRDLSQLTWSEFRQNGDFWSQYVQWKRCYTSKFPISFIFPVFRELGHTANQRGDIPRSWGFFSDHTSTSEVTHIPIYYHFQSSCQE